VRYSQQTSLNFYFIKPFKNKSFKVFVVFDIGEDRFNIGSALFAIMDAKLGG